MTQYRYVPYTLTLQSPAILTALGGEPNSSLTLPYIPGSTVRGAVARALGDPKDDRLRLQEFRHLVLGERVRYLHAYPCAEDPRHVMETCRSLPAPVSFRRKKDASAEKLLSIYDLAAFDGHPSPDDEDCWPKEQLARLGQSFLTIGVAQPQLIQPKVSARIHHQRDREKGRAWKDRNGKTHGAIFTFESLDAGQSFQGLIQVRGKTEQELDAIVHRLKDLLKHGMLLGRSRRAGYGGMAAILWGEPQAREVHGVGKEGLCPVTSDIASGNVFRVLLTSACIVRRPSTGQIDPAALPEWIERRLGGRAKLIRTRWAFEATGGFNRKWRLELPQALAVSAGSVFVMEATQDISVGDLLALENEGLGERREEGYGRFLFLDAPFWRFSIQQPKEKKFFPPESPRAPQLILEMEARIVWSHALKKIEQEAASIARSSQHLPSNSLIGRLRTPLRDTPERAIETLRCWLRDGREQELLKQPAMEQLKRCTVGTNKELDRWILEATEAENVLSWIGADVLAQRTYIISEESANAVLIKRSREIAVKLIDAVLAAMALRNKREEGGNDA